MNIDILISQKLSRQIAPDFPAARNTVVMGRQASGKTEFLKRYVAGLGITDRLLVIDPNDEWTHLPKLSYERALEFCSQTNQYGKFRYVLDITGHGLFANSTEPLYKIPETMINGKIIFESYHAYGWRMEHDPTIRHKNNHLIFVTQKLEIASSKFMQFLTEVILFKNNVAFTEYTPYIRSMPIRKFFDCAFTLVNKSAKKYFYVYLDIENLKVYGDFSREELKESSLPQYSSSSYPKTTDYDIDQMYGNIM